MGMNRYHRWLCASDKWARSIETGVLPWALDGVDLGGEVLEIGPGYGATTRVLARRVPRLTAVEIDPQLAARLRGLVDGTVQVVVGDGTALPLPTGTYSAVTCHTMLHHVPAARLQDRLFAEAYRVLRPGGVFVGSDSQLSVRFRLIHLGDTMVVVDAATLPDRLRAAGFRDVTVDLVPARRLRFRAYK